MQTLKLNEATLNKKILFLSTTVVLSLIFFAAISLFQTQQVSKGNELVNNNLSALTRIGAPTKGAADAKVTIVEFFDPACETCAKFYPLVNNIIKKYQGKVKVEMRYTPFHQGSEQVVKLLEAAHLQGKFWPALEILFAKQSFWTYNHVAKSNQALQLLSPLPLNQQQLKIDMESKQIKNIVSRDITDAKSLEVRATPQFFINGKPLANFGYKQLVQSVERAITLAY